MSKPDEAHRQTDAQLAKLERRVARVYQEARDDLQKTAEDYFERFQERDEEMKALIGTVQNGRKWTANDYKQWRLNQIARGKRFEALRDKMAERYTKANETAMSYVNDRTPGIYSLNRNYGAYLIDKATGGALTVGPDGQTLNADFILFDEQTVKRLIAEAPDVMPYYPPERAVRRGIDLAYGKSRITKNVTSGVLRGLSVKEMADSLQERIQTMERNGAIRAVRTAVTAAQNAGRMDSYRAAGEMGIKLKKRWLATLDGRTRHSHRRLDGETRDTDEAFSNGCLYPGDPRGAPHETYNCRCTLIADLPDFDLSPGQRRAKGATADAEDKSSFVIADMTYSQWAGWVKKGLANSGRSGIMSHGEGVMQIDGRETETGGKQYPLPEYATDRDVQAAEAYRKISRVNDTEIIARNSGFSVEDIVEIKRHVFFEKHKTYDGYKLLQPDYDMAVAWNRLRAGRPEARDILLLQHELLESKIEKERNCSLSEAHSEAKKLFDWEAALIESVGEEGEPDGLL